MNKVQRIIRYANGTIKIATLFEKIEFVVWKNGELVDAKLEDISFDAKGVMEFFISSFRQQYNLGITEDDCVVVTTSKIKASVRGMGNWVAILYGVHDSKYYKECYLPYNYEQLTFCDYFVLFSKS